VGRSRCPKAAPAEHPGHAASALAGQKPVEAPVTVVDAQEIVAATGKLLELDPPGPVHHDTDSTGSAAVVLYRLAAAKSVRKREL